MNESFVVGLNRAEVLRRRAIVRRTRQIGGAVTLFLSASCIALAAGLAVAYPDSWPYAVLVAVSMLPLLLPTLKALKKSAELKRWYDAADLPPFALRMTPAALELGVEGAAAPVVLPWPAVLGLRQQRKLGQPILEVVLQQGVTPTSPGVSGLEQPAARPTLKPSRRIKTARFYSVASLDQPVEAIDQALRHYSHGLAGIAR